VLSEVLGGLFRSIGVGGYPYLYKETNEARVSVVA